MIGPILIVLAIILFLNPKLLPGMGSWLGGQSRRPFRQAKWMWNWFAGSEEESIRAEQEYGQECARAFSKQFPGKVSRTDQALVADVGSRLADSLQDSCRRFCFITADSDAANAFALPGGFVFITVALLDLCGRDADEIAFFLGHEMGHILLGHAREQLTAAVFLNAVLARLPAAGFMLRQFIDKGYSKTLELEADKESVRLLRAAGFDPRASIRALDRLKRVAPGLSGFAEYLSSHPPLSERVRQLERYR